MTRNKKTSSHSRNFKDEVSFGGRKKGYILGVGRVEKSIEESVENFYYVSGLKYNLIMFPRFVIRKIKSSSLLRVVL